MQQSPAPGYAGSSSSSSAPPRGQTGTQRYSKADLFKLSTRCPRCEYPVTFRSLATGGHKGVCEARDSTWTQMNQDDVFRGMGITVSQERTQRQALVYVYDVPARLILGPGEGRPSSWQVLPSQPPARRSPPRHPPVQQPQQSSGQHMHLYPQQATEALTHLAYRYNDTGSLTKKASWERK